MAMIRPEIDMKDSGIEYVGAIPKDWDLVRLRAYFGERKNKNKDGNETNLLSLSYGRIIRKNIDKTDGLLPASFNTYNIVEKNDIIIRPTDLQNDKRSLRTGLVTEHGIITSAYIDLMPIGNVDSRFVHYLLHSYDILKVFYNMGSGVRQGLNYSEFSKLKVPMPLLSEQQAIADYLDETCSRIDEIIAEAKASIDEYKELKQSVFFEAVTKGLDKNVEMKDSCVEWIGEMPDSWNIRMLNQYVSQVKCKNSDLSETNLLSLSYGKIKRKDINSNGGLLPESFDNYNIVDENDIVLRLTDLQNDHKSLRVGLVTERGIITSAYVTIRPKKINAAYLALLLHAFDYKKGFYGMGSGIRQGLTFDGVKSLKIVVPSVFEQDDIVKHVMKMTDKCDSLIAEKESLIKDLESYKKSLIYEVVTGKRRVV